MKNIKIYTTSNNKQPYVEWLEKLDQSTKDRIDARILKVAYGHFGDFKALKNNIKELRFHFGAGYRVYFAEDGNDIVLLLCGGDKNSQSRDIKKAEEYFETYLKDKK